MNELAWIVPTLLSTLNIGIAVTEKNWHSGLGWLSSTIVCLYLLVG